MSEDEFDDGKKPKFLKKSPIAKVLARARLDAPSRLIMVLDKVDMPSAKIKASKEHAIRYVIQHKMTSRQVLTLAKGRPGRILELCEWCQEIQGPLPYTVALGTTWKEHKDTQDWVAFADQLDDQRIFTGDRFERVWPKGTSFLFFVQNEAA